MVSEIIHAIALIFVIGLTFILAKTHIYEYQLQITAIIFIIYFLSRKFIHTSSVVTIFGSRLIDAIVFTFTILSFINGSGGLTSPLFFLTYFLLFGLALLLEPVISLTTTLALIIFFLLSIPEGQAPEKILPLFSLPFITPFAWYLGKEHKKNVQLKIKNSSLETEVTDQKKDGFLFLSLVIKDHLKTITNASENFIDDRDLNQIKDAAKRAQILIEKFENDQ